MAIELSSSMYQRMLDTIRRANAIAATHELDALLDQMVDLFMEVTDANAGSLYLYDAETDELEFKVVKGDPQSLSLLGQRFPASRGIVGVAIRTKASLFIDDVENDPRWERRLSGTSSLRLRTVYCLPLQLRDRPIGVVQVFNLPPEAIDEEG